MSSELLESLPVKNLIEHEVRKAIDEILPFSVGQMGALVNKLGGKRVVERLLKGELHLVVENRQAYLLETEGKLVDRNGRIISNGLSWPVSTPRYLLVEHKPDQNLWDSARLLKVMMDATSLEPERFMPQQKLEQKLRDLLSRLENDKRLSNLLKGRRALVVPVVLPMLYSDGAVWEAQKIMQQAAVRVAVEYSNIHSLQPPIIDYANVESPLTISDRHSRLLNRLKLESVAGMMFPLAFRGFSPWAVMEIEDRLPENASVAGLYDGLAAFVAYPGLLRHVHAAFPGWSSLKRGACALSQCSPFSNRGIQRIESELCPGDKEDEYLDSGLLFTAD